MRILYFTRSDSVHDQRFMNALLESGHTGYVLRLYRGDYPTPNGITPIHWRGIKGPLRTLQIPGLVYQLRRTLRELKPHLVHAGPIHDAAFLAARAGADPLLTMSWGFDLMHDVQVSPLLARRARYALARSTRLITDAHSSADEAVKLGFDAAKICVFPWGVDLDHFSPLNTVVSGKKWREARGWSDNTVLLCLRSMEPNYGVDVLARAFTAAARQNPALRLILLGDGSQRESILKLLEDGGVMDKVYVGGRVANAELTTFYGAADVYITPSHVDGSSVSLMEAMASGLPTIASDIPANLEWVRPGDNGWIFPDGDWHKLSQIIQAAHTADLRALSRQARLDAQQKADWNKNQQVLLACYEQTMASIKGA